MLKREDTVYSSLSGNERRADRVSGVHTEYTIGRVSRRQSRSCSSPVEGQERGEG
jgi:hypothetical protein